MKERIFGRTAECELLSRIEDSPESEFVALCGRRRVGKTFLIREYFAEKIVFYCCGLAKTDLKTSLKNFSHSLKRYSGDTYPTPADWFDAFEQLIQYLSSIPVKRKVIFLDELPWLDTPRSGFISALEHFWNNYASARHDIVLIVGISATSWMMDHLINEHGGLYDRLTHRILLKPFNLRETRQFLERRQIFYSDYEIAECYMIMGGIPHYLRLLDKTLSLSQNIDRLFFNPNGELFAEFDNLYNALFIGSENYIKVVTALSQKGSGLNRHEIYELSGVKSGGTLSRILNDLETCGFIRKYSDYTCAKNKGLYQLIDFYTIFYFKFIQKSSFKDLKFWNNFQGSPAFYAWAALSFERLCLLHEQELKQALGISGIKTRSLSFQNQDIQIDLLIDRGDNTINICEMKFTEGPFEIDKDYELKLRDRLEVFKKVMPKRKSIQLTMVTTFGVKKNAHFGVVNSEVQLSDLFA